MKFINECNCGYNTICRRLGMKDYQIGVIDNENKSRKKKQFNRVRNRQC